MFNQLEDFNRFAKLSKDFGELYDNFIIEHFFMRASMPACAGCEFLRTNRFNVMGRPVFFWRVDLSGQTHIATLRYYPFCSLNLVKVSYLKSTLNDRRMKEFFDINS